MTRLEELLYSLTAVIIRYHDSQPKVKKLIVETDAEASQEKYLTCAKEIIQNQAIHFKIKLNNLIKHCADSGRRPFLYYLLHEVISLKTLLDKEGSFDSAQLEEYKNQISQLFIDLKLLLDTPKSKTYTVTYSKTKDTPQTLIALSGLSEGYGLCNSGEILKGGVLKRFGITTHSTKDALKSIAEQICMEHHRNLLVPELQAQVAEHKKTNIEQEQKLSSLSMQQQEKQKKADSMSSKQLMTLYLFYIQYKKMQARDEQLKAIIDKQQKIINEQQQKVSELTQQTEKKPSSYKFYSPF